MKRLSTITKLIAVVGIFTLLWSNFSVAVHAEELTISSKVDSDASEESSVELSSVVKKESEKIGKITIDDIRQVVGLERKADKETYYKLMEVKGALTETDDEQGGTTFDNNSNAMFARAELARLGLETVEFIKSGVPADTIAQNIARAILLYDEANAELNKLLLELGLDLENDAEAEVDEKLAAFETEVDTDFIAGSIIGDELPMPIENSVIESWGSTEEGRYVRFGAYTKTDATADRLVDGVIEGSPVAAIFGGAVSHKGVNKDLTQITINNGALRIEYTGAFRDIKNGTIAQGDTIAAVAHDNALFEMRVFIDGQSVDPMMLYGIEGARMMIQYYNNNTYGTYNADDEFIQGNELDADAHDFIVDAEPRPIEVHLSPQ